MTLQPTPSNSQDPNLDRLVARAKEDLAHRLSIPVGRIDLLEAQEVVWPDASLGCPQPGMEYAQVITPGYRLALEAEGQTYEYHTDGGQNVILCEEEPMADMPTIPGTVEPGLGGLIGLAKEDLAQRLSIPVDQIEVLEAKAVVWPDASLGCPQPGMRYRQVPMDGALIRLGVEGQVYEYHSGGGRAPFLCEQPLKLQKDAPPQLDLLQLTPGSPSE